MKTKQYITTTRTVPMLESHTLTPTQPLSAGHPELAKWVLKSTTCAAVHTPTSSYLAIVWSWEKESGE